MKKFLKLQQKIVEVKSDKYVQIPSLVGYNKGELKNQLRKNLEILVRSGREKSNNLLNSSEKLTIQLIKKNLKIITENGEKKTKRQGDKKLNLIRLKEKSEIKKEVKT